MSPRGRTKALEQMQPRTTASSGGALTMPTANKAIHTAQGPWPLQGPCLSRAQRHLPGQKSEPKHQACLTEACRCEAGSAGGPGHPSLVTILTAGVARNPIHPAAAAPAGVSRALGNEGGEERRSGQRREQCPSPAPGTPSHTKRTRPPWVLAWAHSAAKNDPHSLSYQMEAALKAFLVSGSTLNYVVSIYPT